MARWSLPLLLASSGQAASSQPAASLNLHTDVVFDQYPPDAEGSELLRRTLSPLALEVVRRRLASSGGAVSAQSLDLPGERFVVYVPPRAPPGGYGVLVFVPPWQKAALPAGWASELDQAGVIYISAARSGNDESVAGRREPLALIGARNIIQHYPVDPARVYVGGFSGGARIALRLALDYPDLFRGALLNAGSDPLGRGGAIPPSREMFQQFQQSSRLVYVTGEKDDLHRAADGESAQSMRTHCVYDLDVRVAQGAAHELAGAGALGGALRSLKIHAPADPARLAACRATLDRDLAQSFQRVEAMLASGKRDAARSAILDIDARFGGLAAPRIVDLAQACACKLLP